MNSANKEIISQFIECETATNLRKAGRIWKIGGALVVFVIGYMIWIVSSISSFLNPTDLGAVVAGNIDAAVPGYLTQAEEYLQEQAPLLANQLSEEAFEMLKTLRPQGEKGMDHAMNMLVAFRGGLETTLNTHFKTHAEEIKDLYAAHKHDDIAGMIVNDLTAAVGENFDAMLRASDDGEGWLEIKSSTLEALQNVNNGLEKLAKSPLSNLTKTQQAQRRVIAAFVHALNHEFKDQRVDLTMLME